MRPARTLRSWPSAIPVPSSVSSRRHPDPDQGCLASPGTDEPSRPDRRRSGCLARRDATDGRDQRRLCALTREIDGPGAAWIGCGRHAVRARRRTSTRGPASPEADPAGHRPGRHQRDIPAPEPGGRQRRGTDDPPWPAAASRRPCRKRAATRVDADGPARPRSAASFPAATGALAPAGRGDGHPVRQVPRPHARSDRGLRAVVHRLGGGDRQPRSGPGQRGAGHPGRSRSPGGPPARPPDVRARRPHRLSGCRKRTIALRYRRATLMLMFGSPSDNRCRPDGPPGLLAEEPVTRLVSWIRDPSPEPPRTNDRFQFRDRRPRDLLV